MQQLSQLSRSTTTDPIEHISEEKSLLKIIAKIFLISLTSSLTSYQGDSTVASYGVRRWRDAVVVAFNKNILNQDMKHLSLLGFASYAANQK